MVAGPVPAAHLTVDFSIEQAVAQIGGEEEMVEPEAGVSRPAHAHVVPEGVDALVGMQMAKGIGPASAHQPPKAARLSGWISASSSHEVVG